MDTYKDAVVLNDLWARGRGALDGSGTARPERRDERARWSPAATASSPRTWRGRCSSAATRCASSTGPTRASPTSAGRAAPASTCSGSRDEVELVEADLRDAEAVARGGRRLRLGLPPRRADDRRRRPRLAAGDASRSTSAAPGTSRGLPRARGRAGRLRLLRQGLRRQPGAALPRGLPAARRLSLRGQQGRRRPRSPAATRTPTGCRSRSPASPTSTAAATSTSRG